MNEHAHETDPLETILAEFSERLRQGETPTVDEYVERHPDLEDDIRDLLGTVEQLERLKSRNERSTGSTHCMGPLTIEQLGDFHIVREIGRGGMGIVFEAEQQSLARHVAIKVLPRQPWQDEKHREQFKREAQVAAGLHHTHIVPIYGVGEDEGYHYYAMQLITGVGLDRVIAWLGHRPGDTTTEKPSPNQIGPLCKKLFGRPSDVTSLTRAYWHGVAHIGQQVAHALAYAHGQNVVHRDIKPGNLLVDHQGQIWITDFGLAHAAQAAGVTQPGSVAGTLRYLAPEQFQGQVDARSDIYSLGATLYELLTQGPVYDAPDHTSLIRMITQDEPRAPRKTEPRIPRDLETIVLKAMTRDPRQRYATAQEVADDLQNYLQGRPIMAGRLSPGQRLWLWAKRNPTVAILSMATAACLIAAGAAGWTGYYHTQQALRRESMQLTQTRHEYERAEANLTLALQAFEGVFSHMTSGGFSSSLQTTEDPVYEPMVSPRDVRILQGLLGFYDQFAQQNQEASHLQQDIARASYRIGQIHNRLGQFKQAQTACQHAQHLFEQQESDQDVIQLIENGLELGWAIQMLGQHREARDIYGTLRTHMENASTALAGNKKASLLLAQVYLRLGSMPTGQDRHDRRRRGNDPVFQTQTALQLSKALLSRFPQHPPYRYIQALAYRNLAVLEYRAGDVDTAENHVTDAIRLLSELHDQFPEQAGPLYDLALIYSMEEGLGVPPSGPKKGISSLWCDRYQKALTLSQRLVTQHTTVPAYRALLSRVNLRLAEVHLSEGTPSDAVDCLQKAHTELGQLITQDLAASSYVCDYLKATLSLGRQLHRDGSAHQARQVLEKNLTDIERMIRGGPRRKREWVLLARQYTTLAEVCETLNDQSAAVDARDQARRIDSQSL